MAKRKRFGTVNPERRAEDLIPKVPSGPTVTQEEAQEYFDNLEMDDRDRGLMELFFERRKPRNKYEQRVLNELRGFKRRKNPGILDFNNEIL